MSHWKFVRTDERHRVLARRKVSRLGAGALGWILVCQGASAGEEHSREDRAALRSKRCDEDPRVRLGQVSKEACIGADLFFRETFGGNGRMCGSCHPAANNYTVDPKFIAALPEDDPLFIAEQAPNLSQLEVPELLRDLGLFLVNPDGFEQPTEKFVVRSASHILGLTMTTTLPLQHPFSASHAVDGTLYPFPGERLGWSGDGAPNEGLLRDFADGAIKQHATRSLAREEGADFFFPNDEERDAFAAFMRTIGRTNDVDLTAATLSDPGAERGRAAFVEGQCSICHDNAGALTPIAFDDETGDLIFANLSFEIGTALSRPRAVDELGIMWDGGHGPFAFDLNQDGITDSYGNGAMNVSSLIEAADTLPLFHNHSAATIEDAIAFYTTDAFAHSFAGSGGFPVPGEPIPLSDEEIGDLGRFLRVINVALNLQMALRRLEAGIEIAGLRQCDHEDTEIERQLYHLAAEELDDAVTVLGEVKCLHHEAQRELSRVVRRLKDPNLFGTGPRTRERNTKRLRDVVKKVNDSVAKGLDFNIGEGTLMF
jgi:hypothetical protein